jgi:hypothetical protein
MIKYKILPLNRIVKQLNPLHTTNICFAKIQINILLQHSFSTFRRQLSYLYPNKSLIHLCSLQLKPAAASLT